MKHETRTIMKTLLKLSPLGRCVIGYGNVCAPVAAPWVFLFGLLFLIGGQEASAQPYSMDWHSMDGGGGRSVGGSYAVEGTVGQPDAGVHTGAGWRVEGGFWSAFAAVPSPGSPELTIVRVGFQVEIRWAAAFGGLFQLERSPGLGAQADWNPESTPPVQEGAMNVVRLPLQPGFHFFRLSRLAQ